MSYGGEIANNIFGRQYSEGDDEGNEDYEENGEGAYDDRNKADEHQRTPKEHPLTEIEDDDRVDDEVDDDGECEGSRGDKVPHAGAIDD